MSSWRLSLVIGLLIWCAAVLGGLLAGKSPEQTSRVANIGFLAGWFGSWIVLNMLADLLNNNSRIS